MAPVCSVRQAHAIDFIPWGDDFDMALLKSSLRVEHLAENLSTKPKLCCPKAFPFGMPPDDEICYNDSAFVQAGGGPCGSWCTHAPGTAPGCGDDSKHLCAHASSR